MNSTTGSLPRSLTVARIMLALNGVIWVLMAANGLQRASSLLSVAGIVYLLALADAVVILWLAWRLGSGSRLIYYLVLAVVSVNAVLSITDELGLADVAVLILNLVILALLLAGRSHYLVRQEQKSQ